MFTDSLKEFQHFDRVINYNEADANNNSLVINEISIIDNQLESSAKAYEERKHELLAHATFGENMNQSAMQQAQKTRMYNNLVNDHAYQEGVDGSRNCSIYSNQYQLEGLIWKSEVHVDIGS